jgi:tRNA-splicing ligase RtcB
VRVEEHLWEIPRSFREDMRAPATTVRRSRAAARRARRQVGRATGEHRKPPGIVRYALAMPDIHQGYGFPIGVVVATKLPEGVIPPACSLLWSGDPAASE